MKSQKQQLNHIQQKNVQNLSTQIDIDQQESSIIQNNQEEQVTLDNNIRISKVYNDKEQDQDQKQSFVVEKQINQQDLNEKLAFSPKLTKGTKIFIPFLTFFTISIFIFNKLFHGATLQADIVIDGFTSQKIDISYFELLSSVGNMWDAKVYPLAILIFAFSGIWPYAKLLGMVFCWYLPLKYLSYKKREKFLILLDIMGKWSLIDSYFMIIMICAFRFQIQGFLLKQSIELNLAVTPGLTYYLFITGTMLSLVLTHLVLYQHRKTIQTNKKEKKEFAKQSQIRQSLGQIDESDLIMSEEQNLNNQQSNDLESKVFTFEFGGLAGWALRDKYETHYSLLGLVDQLPGKTFNPDGFGIRYIQILFVIFVFVVPLLFQICIFILHKIPLTLQTQKSLFIATEILYSWSSLEVFIVAMVSSVFQIRQFATYMVGSKCEGINQILTYLHETDPEKYNFRIGDQCFELQTQIDWGIFGILVASICYCIQGSFVLRGMQKKLEKLSQQQGDIYYLNTKQKKHIKI